MQEIRLHLRYAPRGSEASSDDREALAALVESVVSTALLEVTGGVEVIDVEIVAASHEHCAAQLPTEVDSHVLKRCSGDGRP
jgi:hypothetical protein